MDYGAFPPEFNSARMYAGPGAGPLLAAAAAWSGLAADLQSVASSYGSIVSGLTAGPWLGPSSLAMAAAAAPYIAWLTTTAGQAEMTGAQAQVAAGAYEAAFAMTVPPPMIAANRAQLMMLIATNFLGQNTAAIAATEAEYGEMWAQDAAAMYGYAATSAAATAKVTQFSAAPQTADPTKLAAPGAAAANAAGTSTGTGVQSALSQLIDAVPTTLQSFASPATSSTGGLLGGTTSASGFSLDGTLQSLFTSYATIPGWFAMFMGGDALGPLMNPDVFLPFMNMGAAAAAPLGAGAAAGAAAAEGILGPSLAGSLGGLGGLGGVGAAASVGALSVPPTWGWAATAPTAMLGGIPSALPLASAGAGLGYPLMLGGVPRASATGGTGSAKYGLPLAAVMTRPPAAGYGSDPTSPPSTAKYPAPLEFPAGISAPPGYQPTIVYLPTNGHQPAKV